MNVPTILTDGNLRGERQPYADAVDMGAQVGQATQGLGQQMSRSTVQIANQRREIENNQWVGQSIEQEKNYINKWMADPNNHSKESFADDLEELGKKRLAEYDKSAPNAGARQNFRLQFNRFMSSRYESAVNTSAAVKVANMGSAVDDMIDNTLNSYRTARTIPNVDANLQLLNDIDDVHGHIDGMFGTIAPKTAKQLKERMTVDAAYTVMDYSPDLATKILDKGKIEGHQRAVLDNQIEQSRQSRNAFEAVQFEEFRKNNLALAEAGKGGEKLDISLYKAVHPDNLAYALKFRDDTEFDIYSGVNQFMSETSSYNGSEQIKSLNALHDKVGSDPKTAYHDQKVYEIASQRTAHNLQQLSKDPVGYMAKNNPTVRKLADAYNQNPKDPDSLKKLVDSIVRFQGPPAEGAESKQYYNVPKNEISVLTNGEAEQYAAKINQGSPKDALKAISNILDQYPEQYQPIVFNDLVKQPGEKGIRGEYWAAAMNKSAWWVDEYLGVIQNANEIKKSATAKLSEFDKALDTNADWLQFMNPLAGDDFQRQNIVESFRNGIQLYAMGLAQKNGMSPDKAVTMSLSRLLKEQQGLTAVNGKPVMIPRDQGMDRPQRTDKDISDIGRRLNLSLLFVAPHEIKTTDEYGRSLFPVLNFAGTEETKMGSLKDAIRAHGTFDTTPDGKSAILYYRDGNNSFEVRDKNNNAFVIEYDQLPLFEQYTLGMSGYGGVPQIRGIPPSGDPMTPRITGGPKYADGTYVGTGRPINFTYGNEPYKTNWPSMPPWIQRVPRDKGGRMGVNKFTIDGDTIIDENGTKHRLLGINAPEVAHPAAGKFENQPLGLSSSNAVYSLTGGKPIRIVTSGKKDKYGRDLSTIYYKDDSGNEINLNEELVRRGLALPK